MTESDTDVTYEVHGPERHDVPAAGRSGFVVIDDRQVHYLEWGAAGAPAVIALHGGGQTAYMFEEIGRELRSTHHVIAPDLPGHGESEALSHDPRDFSRQTLAATLP
ncbi:MAG: alpha/beta fold hydrolase, partial [Frankiaceae bacterium]|nr:alpha/beta fold hydrolase [Frankiaceae bacterium]